jgi:nucleoside-diphosphate-sugar epimerase
VTAQLFVITGATGFVGSSIIRLLKHSNASFVAVSRQTVPRKRGGVRYVGLDELPSLEVGAYRSVAFIHLAAETSAQRWEDRSEVLWRDHEEFLSKAIHFVPSTFHADNIRIVNASTATVVGSTKGVVSNETKGTPETRYDAWKIRQEDLILTAARDMGASSVSLRLPNIYGRPQYHAASGRGFVTRQVEMALRGHPLYYYEQVPFIRDYLHVDDAARAFILAADPSISFARNQVIGTGVGTSMAQLMHLIADSVHDCAGRRPHVLEVPAPVTLTELDKRSVQVDSSEFRKVAGWQPQITIARGIRKMVRDMNRYFQKSS